MRNRWNPMVMSTAIAVTAALHGGLAAQAQSGQAAGSGAVSVAPAAVTRLTSPVTGNAANGKRLYHDYACYSCHGFNGETGARPFVPNWPPNLGTERSFTAFLRGRANVSPVNPSSAMPNYPVESLSDAQARDLYAFIRSFRSTPPPVERIPVMVEILEAAKRPYTP